MTWEKALLATPDEVKALAIVKGYVHMHRTREPQNGTYHWLHVMNTTVICSEKDRCVKSEGGMMRTIEVTGTTHRLKSWSKEFEAVADGVKNFEVRRNDRDYQPGDVLVLREWVPTTGACGVSEDYRKGRSQYGPCNLAQGHMGMHEDEYGYTGREERVIITYVYRGDVAGAPLRIYAHGPGNDLHEVVVLALASNIDVGQ